MSIKPVELHMALHKNDEVGVKQQELSRRPVTDQMALGQQAEKTTIKERQVSAAAEQAHGSGVHGELPKERRPGGARGRVRGGKEQVQEKREQVRGDHPFKGHHIDLSL
ncbi:hypothetical protein J2T17_000610 [Paenibacillus mucilaginosus]|uniref:hypothetical protein n=1 Tax=Paenibacillus mucilaginosus TaxID=61624 RepID=UPI003D224689